MNEYLKLVAIIPDCDNETEIWLQFNRQPTRDELVKIQRFIDFEASERSSGHIGKLQIDREEIENMVLAVIRKYCPEHLRLS